MLDSRMDRIEVLDTHGWDKGEASIRVVVIGNDRTGRLFLLRLLIFRMTIK